MIATIKNKHLQKCSEKTGVFDFVETKASKSLFPFLGLGKKCKPLVKYSMSSVFEFNKAVVGCLNTFRVRYQGRPAIRNVFRVQPWLKFALHEMSEQGETSDQDKEAYTYYETILEWWPKALHKLHKQEKI